MKITICGSSTFKQEMLDYEIRLQELGHEAIVHPHYGAYIRGEKPEILAMIAKEHAKAKSQFGYIKWYHDAIISSDAILVLNFDKKDIPNYIGCNTLIEIAFAYAADKKIFLLQAIPDQPYIWDEINAMEPIVINGDLSLIK